MPPLQTPIIKPTRVRPLQFDHLPVFPSVAIELIELMDRQDSSVHQITRILRREPALSAEVLRHSNTAVYIRHKGEVVDLDTALVVMGLAAVRKVSLNAAVRGMIGVALGLPELRHCWTHCVATAVIAEHLAPDHQVRAGAAYVAGLLHDLGMLALLSIYPTEYQQMLLMVERDEVDWRTAEREVFGRDHEQVGSLIIDKMALPASLRPVLTSHHDWEDYAAPGMLPLVACADRVAGAVGFRVGGFPPQESVEALFEYVSAANPRRTVEEIEALHGRIADALL